MNENEQNTWDPDQTLSQQEQALNEQEQALGSQDYDKNSLSEPEISLDRIDLNALWVVRRLRAKGHEAYLTGGCVRDLLLNKKPKDFDVATSAQPEEVRSIFRNCRLIGRRFLLAHVVFPGGKIIETATFRAKPSEEVVNEEEGEDLLVTKDNVYGTMMEDAFRRDLTINGLFYDPVEGKVIDYVNGREDLAAGLIRTIGDPQVRLQEDPVRILRAIRFAMRLGFRIEEQTLNAMKEFSHEILRCSPSRLQEEITRLLTSGHAAGCMKLCLEVGVLEALMPELIEGLGLVAPDQSARSEQVAGYEHAASEQGELALSDHEIGLVDVSEHEEILENWYKILSALDEVYARNCNVVSSVAFTALLLPAYMRLEKSNVNERNWIDRLCVSWASRIRLTHRDQDSIRILLTAIPLFHLDKIHQKSAQYLVRKPWFREGLLIYVIYLISNNESLEQVKIWKILARDADKPYLQDRHGMRPSQPRFRKRRMPMRNPPNRRYRRPTERSAG